MAKLLRLVRSVLAWSLDFMSTYKLTTLVSLVLLIGFVGISVLIGMPPFGYVIIIGLVALPTIWYIVRSQRADLNSSNSLSNKRLLKVIIASSLGMLVVIQAIPYGHNQANPAVGAEPQWATPATRDLMVRACFGCHSNEVVYPAYAKIAPISWTVQWHVDEGRGEVNYSEFDFADGDDDSIEAIQEGSMPPGYYTRFGRHPEANLTAAEVEELLAGLKATPGFNLD